MKNSLLRGRGDEFSVDDDVGGVGGGFEGVAIEEGEVGVFSRGEGADLVIEAKNFCGVNGAGGEGDFPGKTVGGGESGFEVDYAGLGDVGLVAGLEGEGDAFLMELGGEGEGHVFEVAEGAAHGGVDDDGDAGGFDFLEEEVGFGGAIEDEIESEFFAESEGGGDVLMALGIDEERGLFVEDVDEDLEFNIGRGGVFFVIGLGGTDLACMGLGFEEFGAEEGDGLGSGAGGFGEGAGAKGGSNGGGGNEGVVEGGDGGDVCFDDHELAGDEGSRGVPGVDGGDAEITEPFDEGVAAVIGVDGAEFGLDGGGFLELFLVVLGRVEDAGEADSGVGVDDAGGGDFYGEGLVALGDLDIGADGLDGAIRTAEDDGIFDRLEIVGHREEKVGFDGDLGVGGGEAQAEEEEKEGFEHDEEGGSF